MLQIYLNPHKWYTNVPKTLSRSLKLLTAKTHGNFSSSSSSFTLTQLQYNNKEKKGRSKNRANYTLNSTGKKEECVAAKGAKLSSWLLPQSSYKRRLRSITLIKID